MEQHGKDARHPETDGSRTRSAAGTVTMSFDVDATGKVHGSSVVKSSGHPALAGGKPVSASVKVQYAWRLN
ncbi:TonB family protein [Janthinobacterium sp. FT14W]|uniref:TonB family protein n=1 Tax=Janthinobacterium sp. FT14W TaxID=2654253 RepID=UPI00126538CD|nr:TonB family protein [Janthinobacterium sp. FT14W]KAB8060547.1 TonB family protein [Janthinobacterium sp. FT14W]